LTARRGSRPAHPRRSRPLGHGYRDRRSCRGGADRQAPPPGRGDEGSRHRDEPISRRDARKDRGIPRARARRRGSGRIGCGGAAIERSSWPIVAGRARKSSRATQASVPRTAKKRNETSDCAGCASPAIVSLKSDPRATPPRPLAIACTRSSRMPGKRLATPEKTNGQRTHPAVYLSSSVMPAFAMAMRCAAPIGLPTALPSV
jgi:hypothetical protein